MWIWPGIRADDPQRIVEWDTQGRREERTLVYGTHNHRGGQWDYVTPLVGALTELSRALLDSSVDLLDTKSALGPFHVLWVPKRYAGS